MRIFLTFIHCAWLILLSILCLGLVATHKAYSAELTLDLITAYELAVRHDPQIASARFENLASKELKNHFDLNLLEMNRDLNRGFHKVNLNLLD
jgi:hypothetical protein